MIRMSNVFLLVLPGLVSVAPVNGQTDDEAAVRQTLEHYLAGHATGDPTHMRAAFHPEAKLFWIQDGVLRQRSSADYIAGFTGRPAADEARRRRWIESVNVSGTAATGKIVLDYPNGRFVDYMAVLQIEGEWKIVNKIFHRDPRP